jgi:hypothetical protein
MRAPEQGDALEIEAARHSCTVPATPSNDCGFVVVLVVVTWSTPIVGIPAGTLRRTCSSAGRRPRQICACPGSAGGVLPPPGENGVDLVFQMRAGGAAVRPLLKSYDLAARMQPLNPKGASDEVVEHVATDLGLPIKGADRGPKSGAGTALIVASNCANCCCAFARAERGGYVSIKMRQSQRCGCREPDHVSDLHILVHEAAARPMRGLNASAPPRLSVAGMRSFRTCAVDTTNSVLIPSTAAGSRQASPNSPLPFEQRLHSEESACSFPTQQRPA